MQGNEDAYGVGDNSYKAAGELAGLTRLVDAFYEFMSTLPEVKRIRDMHPDDLFESRRKLTCFLSGWLGGPRLYKQYYGAISIPGVHSHLDIGIEERNMWLLCMQNAIEQQPYTEAFKKYLLAQLFIPADRIRQVCTRKK